MTASSLAIHGPGVFVPARIAAGLERALRLDEYRMRVRGADRQLDEVLLAVHVCALQWSVERRSVDDQRTLSDRWTTEEVAARVGITRHAVAAAAKAGRLVGERIDGRWTFEPDMVAIWRSNRRRGST